MKRIATNFFSLSGLQIANYALPLITLPYIVRVIGPDKFGTLNFAQALVAYLNLLILYAYDFSATREISAYRHDIQRISKIFFTVTAARLLLFLVSSLIFGGLIIGVPRVRHEYLLYLYIFMTNIGIVFFPTWFYQGIERLSKVAIYNFMIKLIFTAAVFILVRAESDYVLIPLSTCIGQVLIGIWAFYDAIRIGQLSWVHIRFRDIGESLRQGLKLFLSNIVISLYTTTNTVILGFLSTTLNVGYFTAASKLMYMIQGLFLYPLSQTLYPYFSKTFSQDYEKGKAVLEKILVFVAVLTIIVSLVLFIFSKSILWIVYGQKYDAAISSLRLLSFLPFIIGLSNVCGIQGMLNLKMDKEFLWITTIGAVMSVLLNLLFVPFLYETGTALAWLITEIFITGTTLGVLIKKKIIRLTLGKVRKILVGLYHV